MQLKLKKNQGISMRKNQGGYSRVPHIIGFAVAIVLALMVVAFLPIPIEYKKLLFFILIIVFAILAVLIPNIIRRK